MKRIITLILALIITSLSIAQNGINYKALIKDDNGNALSNAPISIQFTIYEGAALNNNVYQEDHIINTDANGFIAVSIGQGATSDSFSTINWSNDEHFLNVQVNTGSGLIDIGTTQFMTVPYALSSADNPWTNINNGMYTTNNAVGINAPSPEHTFDVRSSNQSDPSGFNLSNSDKSRYIRFFSGSEMFPDPSISWIPGNNLLFATFNDTTLDFEEKMRISTLGDVGIGIADPEARLDVKGGDWNLEAGNPGDLRIGNASHNFRIGVAIGGGGAGITRMYTNSNDLILGTNDTSVLKLDQNGSVTMPNMTNSLIESSGDKTVVTKEYVDDAIDASPATKTITYGASYFRPSTSNAACTIQSGMFAYCSDGGTSLLAPIVLPVGSYVTEVKVFLRDDVTSNDLRLSLFRHFDFSGGISFLISDEITGSPGNVIRTYSDGFEILDNYQYIFRVNPSSGDSWIGNSLLSVVKVKITYTE